MRFYISMHDSLGMAIIQCLYTYTLTHDILDKGTDLEELIDVVSNVPIRQRWVQHLEICIVNVFKYQTRCLRLWIPNNVQQTDNVRSSTQRLQNLNLSLDLTHPLVDSQLTELPTFFFLTGFRILMMHFVLSMMLIPSNTSLYFPLPTFRTT